MINCGLRKPAASFGLFRIPKVDWRIRASSAAVPESRRGTGERRARLQPLLWYRMI